MNYIDKMIFMYLTAQAKLLVETAISIISEYIDDEVAKDIIDDLQFAIYDIMSATERAEKFNVFKEN